MVHYAHPVSVSESPLHYVVLNHISLGFRPYAALLYPALPYPILCNAALLYYELPEDRPVSSSLLHTSPVFLRMSRMC